MYIPPYDSLLSALAISKVDLEKSDTVTIPVKLFKLLVKAVVANSDFDENSYFAENPDVRRAVRSKQIGSGFEHFIQFGYFEGRRGGRADVDEQWYTNKYPDIALGVKDGKIDRASSHFYAAGAAEGRSPRPEYEGDAEQWQYAFQSIRK